MANNITLFKKYVPLLDEVYKEAALTSVLDSDSSLAQAGANACIHRTPNCTDWSR